MPEGTQLPVDRAHRAVGELGRYRRRLPGERRQRRRERVHGRRRQHHSLVNGASRQNTVFEYIQEVQVKTTGIPAEFGGALGGVISAVTKSGGNIFTGEGHYYFDGSTLSAGPVKRLVLSPIDDKTVSYVQDDKQPDIRHEFGGSARRPDRA